MRLALSLLAFPALASAQNTVLGGWSNGNVTDAKKATLTRALQSFKCADNVQVCYSKVFSLCEQVVAGMNYMFDFEGCEVATPEGLCSSTTIASCNASHYRVQVYEESWTNTVKTDSLKQVPSDDPSRYPSTTCSEKFDSKSNELKGTPVCKKKECMTKDNSVITQSPP